MKRWLRSNERLFMYSGMKWGGVVRRKETDGRE